MKASNEGLKKEGVVMLEVTLCAAQKAAALAEKKGCPKQLRIGVRAGGCSGWSYFYDFATQAQATDHSWQVGELTILCDPKSMAILTDTVFDYETHLLRSRFHFRNRQAQRTCSCGESFSLSRLSA